MDKVEKRKDNNSVVQVCETLLCGGIAGTVAKTVIAPFDRVKIHFQVQNPALLPYSGRLRGVFDALKMIYQTSGVTGLYRGHSAMILRIFPYAAINYWSYETFRWWLYGGAPAEHVDWWKRVLAGSLAGSTAVTCTYPLDIIRARLAFNLTSRNFDHNISLRHALEGYVKSLSSVVSCLANEGRRLRGFPIAGFYQGFLPTLTGVFPYAGVSFFSFEYLKFLYRKFVEANLSVSIPVYAKLPMGMLAGALAQTAAYPLDVVRRRAQVLQIAAHLKRIYPERPSFVQILSSIVRDQGIKGLFVGLSINYLKVAPATGISFVVYEFLQESLFNSSVN